jgi:hypothetical protein
MSFGATPLDGSSTPIPMSSVVPDGSTTPTALEGGPSISSGGNNLAPASVYVKDGNNVVEGTTTDAANANTIIGQLKQIQSNTAGTRNVSQQATGSTSATLQNSAAANGNGTSLTTLGHATVAFTVSGVFSATVNFEGTEDNSNWVAIEVLAFNSTTPVTTTTATGSFVASCAGMQSVRARVSGYVSGNVTVTAHAVPVSAAFLASSGGGSGGTSSSFGSAFPSTGTAIGASDGVNMQGLQVESSSNKNLKVAIYNGATEVSVTASNALKVDGSAVTQPTNVAQFGGTNVSTGTGAGGAGIPRVTVSNDSNVLSTQSGTWTMQPGNTANTTPWLVQEQAGIAGGSTLSHTMSAASTNATSLKASAGMVYGFCISNANASARYFKLYNKASAPTVGTDTPVTTVQVPGNGTVIRAYPTGAVFGTGIAWAVTTGIANSDTGAVGANDLSIDIDYK